MDPFFQRNEKFDEEFKAYKKHIARCVRLDFVLYNDGTKSGSDIDVRIEFPNSVLIGRQPPAEPEAVRNIMRVQVPHFDPMGANDTLHFDGSTAVFKINTAKHNLPVKLNPIFMTFKSDSPENLSVNYQILCGNLTKPLDGKLNILVQTIDEKIIDGDEQDD